VAQNKSLAPTGPEIQLVVEGEAPRFEILDEHTVRYSWSRPNPFFLPALAAATQLFVYRPAHYLRQFHERYQEPGKLKQLVAQTGSRDWAQLFLRKDRLDKVDNPDQPTLQPWMLTTAPPAERFTAARNPHFHRVDAKGQQLPYIDRFVLQVADGKLVPIKTGAGETDLQARHIAFKDYTFLKESEARSGLKTLLWREARAAHLALYPNLNAADPAWRALFPRSPLPQGPGAGGRPGRDQPVPLLRPHPAGQQHDPAESPLWLDELGAHCTAHDPRPRTGCSTSSGSPSGNPEGTRLMPDGRPLELVVETAARTASSRTCSSWSATSGARSASRSTPSRRAGGARQPDLLGRGADDDHLRDRQRRAHRRTAAEGLRARQPSRPAAVAQVGPAPRDEGRRRRGAGPARGAASPRSLPRVGGGHRARGADADLARGAAALRRPVLLDRPRRRRGPADRRAPQPAKPPDEAIFNWEPHAQFGIYLPDTFWFAK
jgi:peptide/nickel transport system substrate-binding protein